jgi:cytochrome P450
VHDVMGAGHETTATTAAAALHAIAAHPAVEVRLAAELREVLGEPWAPAVTAAAEPSCSCRPCWTAASLPARHAAG